MKASMSDIFIDTNVFIKIFNKEENYEKTIECLVKIKESGWNFKISCIVHFEILWGFELYGGNVEKYWNIIREFEIDIVPLTKNDVELASKLCRSKSRIRDYFIGATVMNRNSFLLTYNVNDFKWTKRAYTPEDFIKHYCSVEKVYDSK